MRAELDLPHGRCVVLELADGDVESALAALPPAERAMASALSPSRRRELVSGRLALRAAFDDAPLPLGFALLANDRGAPVMPAGWVGSISHKGPRAAALAARDGAGHVGVDLERAAPPKVDIARRILTPRELAVTGAALTLRFAIKEAIYKAIDPIVRRYVGFSEVELEVGDAGACSVTVVDPAKLPVAIEAWWCELDGYWLATARARDVDDRDLREP